MQVRETGRRFRGNPNRISVARNRRDNLRHIPGICGNAQGRGINLTPRIEKPTKTRTTPCRNYGSRREINSSPAAEEKTPDRDESRVTAECFRPNIVRQLLPQSDCATRASGVRDEIPRLP